MYQLVHALTLNPKNFKSTISWYMYWEMLAAFLLLYMKLTKLIELVLLIASAAAHTASNMKLLSSS